LDKAALVLEEDHYGMEDVKKRILGKAAHTLFSDQCFNHGILL
jgi:ATP-dependent Lon protease